MINVIKYPDKEDWQEIIKRPVFENASLEKNREKDLGKSKRRKVIKPFANTQRNLME